MESRSASRRRLLFQQNPDESSKCKLCKCHQNRLSTSATSKNAHSVEYVSSLIQNRRYASFAAMIFSGSSTRSLDGRNKHAQCLRHINAVQQVVMNKHLHDTSWVMKTVWLFLPSYKLTPQALRYFHSVNTITTLYTIHCNSTKLTVLLVGYHLRIESQGCVKTPRNL